tara:strand:+ start:844 stop:1314 length:471 start_codon:yes stop_codon:yes gene_type:complete
MIEFSIAALALLLHKCNTNRAAVFLYALFYAFAEILRVSVTSEYHFLLCIVLTTVFICSLNSLSRATGLVVLLGLTEIALALIDLSALVAYNLSVEWLYQLRDPMIYYVAIFQMAALLVTDVRSVNFTAIRYNLSLFVHRARGFFVNRSEIHNSKR